MVNLKTETLVKLESIGKTLLDIDYCSIFKKGAYNYEIDAYENISISHGDLNTDKLGLEYDNGHGRQYIFGFIVFTDGSWLERSEYDGAEWWKYKVKPTLREEKR